MRNKYVISLFIKSIVLLVSGLFVVQQLSAQSLQELEKNRISLPNGWNLTPVGRSYALGDLPLNIAVSPNKKLLAINNNGQSGHSIQLFDAQTEHTLDSIDIPKSWYGIKFTADNRFLYVSGGNDNVIWKYGIEQHRLIKKDSIVLGRKWPVKISPAGIELNDIKNEMYVVTKENNSLYVIDVDARRITKTIPLQAEAYTCILSRDKKIVYISLWGNAQVLLYDVAKKAITDTIEVGSHPNEMCLTQNGKYLFVANANDNSVSVIDVRTKRVIETLNAALYPNAPCGSTTNGLALANHDKVLYIANADNNCLAVFDISEIGNSRSKGFIPVGWYPTSVRVIGKKIFVANGKGFSSMPNPYGPNPLGRKETVTRHMADNQKPRSVQYIGGLFKGTLSVIDKPNERQLNTYSKAVYNNTPYTKEKELNAGGEAGNPVPSKVGDSSPIKYVFYIIKENRTYDQVLSDVPNGNGDTSLLLFGKHVTPNQHKIVDEFTLFDNFYCDAEVSADGHNWSLGAYATDYLEKTWPSNYGGKGGTYDGEGFRRVANNKDGFIWDNCYRHNVSYRTYGEFAGVNKPNISILKDHLCPNYDWSLGVRDTSKYYLWQKDLDSLIANNALTRFNSIRFGNDHTEGMSVGRPTPYAHMADNDLAVGLFLEHLSKSRVWKESVVFIVEDDAQNGADHVDAHRSTLYVAGPYVKRHYTDHTMYSTSSVLRTIELILGLPPMSQYDAAAMPLWRAFSAEPDFKTYTSLPSNINLNDKNVKYTEAAKISANFNFKKEDAVPDALFNEVLWQGLKEKPAPSPNHSAFVKAQKKDD